MADVYNALSSDFLYEFDRAGDHLVTFLDNHDEGRFFGKVGKDLEILEGSRADDILIVAEPDLANMRNTKNLMSMLKSARPVQLF